MVVPTAAAAAEVHRAEAAAAVAPSAAVPVLETARAAQLDLVVLQVLEERTRLRVLVRSGLELLVPLVALALLAVAVVEAVAVVQQVHQAAVAVLVAVAVALVLDRLARAAPAADPLGSMPIIRQ